VRRVQTGESSAEKEVADSLTRISETDDIYNAFISVDAEESLRKARKIDEKISRGEPCGRLAGVPIAVKDNICVKGWVTTGGSKILDGFVSSYSATVISRLEAEGGIIVGKTNMDEFGMGSSTENSAYFPTKNPRDISRVPGGSSGGSGAAVAANMVPVALGSDTGGSIRLPASYCGVTGFKPSYGRVSRHGLLAYASSLDTIGPICNNVQDAALIMEIISGCDKMDSTSANAPVPDFGGLPDRLDGKVVGIIKESLFGACSEEVENAINHSIEVLKSLGATTKIVSLSSLEAATAAYYVLATSEASANLARYDGIRYGVRNMDADNAKDVYMKSRADNLGDEVKRRIMLGTYALSSGYYDAYYEKAEKVRAKMREQFRYLFAGDIDVLISPVAPTTAFELGDKMEDQTEMYKDDQMTVPASLAGLPALSMPCGYGNGELPIGMQIIGPYLGEEAVLGVANAFEKALGGGVRERRLEAKMEAVSH